MEPIRSLNTTEDVLRLFATRDTSYSFTQYSFSNSTIRRLFLDHAVKLVRSTGIVNLSFVRCSLSRDETSTILAEIPDGKLLGLLVVIAMDAYYGITYCTFSVPDSEWLYRRHYLAQIIDFG